MKRSKGDLGLRLLSFMGNFCTRRAMEDRRKADISNSVKVVEDAPDEVVRLDTGRERVRVSKSGEIAEARYKLPVDEPEELEKELGSIDPETSWLEDSSEAQKRSAPMGWFYLLGLILLGVIIWGAFQSLDSDESSNEQLLGVGAGGEVVDGKPLGKEADAKAREDAAEHLQRTEEVLSKFFAGKTIEEKVKYVRHPERVLPLMKDFYSRNEIEVMSYKRFVSYRSFTLESFPFIVLEVEDEEGGLTPVLLEDGEDGILVDWESLVCYQPVLFEKYLEERPTEAVNLRAFVEPDFFYTYEFSSEEDYACYKLSFRNSEIKLNGYVKRGTGVDKKFETLFEEGEKGQMRNLILKVRFLEDGKAKKSVLIEDVISTLWAFPSDPAKVASSAE